MQQNIKLIITDLDGTLLRTDKTISDYTLQILAQCRQQNILLAIATARSEGSSKKFIDLIKPDIIISNGGALATMNGRILYKCMLPAATSNALIGECLNNPNVGIITVEADGCYFTNNNLFREPADYAHAVYTDYAKPFDFDTYKITVEIFDKETAHALSTKFEDCSMLAFSGENWHRFAHRDATKLCAIEEVACALQIELDDIAAFGDDYNDLEMLKRCGCGVAVANGNDESKIAAKFRTVSNDDDGVAKFIENIFL